MAEKKKSEATDSGQAECDPGVVIDGHRHAGILGPPAVNHDGRDPLDSPQEWAYFERMEKESEERLAKDGRLSPFLTAKRK